MKEILLSVKPEHLAKILNGEKTLEIRKTMPKCELPCKVWLYCTNSNKKLFLDKIDNKYHYGLDSKKDKFNSLNGKVVGYFVLSEVYWFEGTFDKDDNYSQEIIMLEVDEDDSKAINQYEIATNERDDKSIDDNWLCEKSCLNFNEIKKYVGYEQRYFYGWKIEDLTILDKPFSLLDEEQLDNPKTCLRISKAPQSWCYCKYDKDGWLPF